MQGGQGYGVREHLRHLALQSFCRSPYGKRLEGLSIPHTASNHRTGGPMKAQLGPWMDQCAACVLDERLPRDA